MEHEVENSNSTGLASVTWTLILQITDVEISSYAT